MVEDQAQRMGLQEKDNVPTVDQHPKPDANLLADKTPATCRPWGAKATRPAQLQDIFVNQKPKPDFPPRHVTIWSHVSDPNGLIVFSKPSPTAPAGGCLICWGAEAADDGSACGGVSEAVAVRGDEAPGRAGACGAAGGDLGRPQPVERDQQCPLKGCLQEGGWAGTRSFWRICC